MVIDLNKTPEWLFTRKYLIASLHLGSNVLSLGPKTKGLDESDRQSLRCPSMSRLARVTEG